ncbi:hypothetical protein [Streptosporangium sp. NPDC049078]|uniref:hypothetical protein n=1 Tax=Streptosporangium sp. NPDC049078 TaxID=3155767 RepID=UPI0034360964
MTAYEAQRPIFRVRCDGDGCAAEFEPNSDWISRFADNTSRAAGHAGWDVPPPRGKGSRRGTHFCPQCRTERSGGAS